LITLVLTTKHTTYIMYATADVHTASINPIRQWGNECSAGAAAEQCMHNGRQFVTQREIVI